MTYPRAWAVSVLKRNGVDSGRWRRCRSDIGTIDRRDGGITEESVVPVCATCRCCGLGVEARGGLR
ncbi:MAG: hypothetical protein ACF8GE_09730, partial [Phycisphaerales bacterium JB043]